MTGPSESVRHDHGAARHGSSYDAAPAVETRRSLSATIGTWLVLGVSGWTALYLVARQLLGH